jgi:predicted AlkP superfamily phosphohydrolase/phosphomutase
VRPGAEYDALCAELDRELGALVETRTGRRVVRRVLRSTDAYPGAPTDGLPDLLVEWDPSFPVSAVSSPTIGLVEGAYGGPRTGDHKGAGLLVAVGPGVRPGALAGGVAVEDLAPTIAGLLGEHIADTDGRALTL